jgi:hypothetical protein
MSALPAEWCLTDRQTQANVNALSAFDGTGSDFLVDSVE